MRVTTTQIVRALEGGSQSAAFTRPVSTPGITSQGEEMEPGVPKVLSGLLNLNEIKENCTHYAEMWPSLPPHLLIDCVENISTFPIARTTSSDILKGYIKRTGVVMKTFRSSATPTRTLLKKFYYEALLLSKIQHPNINPFIGLYITQSQKIFMISKFMNHGTLPQYLASFPEADRLKLLSGVANAVMYLHNLSAPVLHGDIRGANVLVNDDGLPYLIDLGYSLIMDISNSSFFPLDNILGGSPRWTSGEKLRSGEFPLTLKADIYSFACLCVEVFSGEVPFKHLNEGAVIVEVLIRHKHPPRPEGPGTLQLSDALWDMIESCFARDPTARPSMNCVHNFIESASTNGP
ncbi:kinase-like domain-containing protein [Collybia nuda]|uniref:Kinase-like domain-containing protein n=1 Tax=Collybia nuda TaxID=64659 RepID=A0A9P6CED0_9AGAR|nr:kinase-like domain-containing protein [Collybia nuda]